MRRSILALFALLVAALLGNDWCNGAALATPAAKPLAASPPVSDQAALAKLSAAPAGPAEKLLHKPAKQVFGNLHKPTTGLPAESIGSYANGCLAGAQQLPYDGPAWQIMRPSRNRNWGNPVLIALVERLAKESKANDGWNGLLMGDIAQPRGGPMVSGHASHQIGLDADVWLTPMPSRVLTAKERETMEPVLMAKDRKTLNTAVWTESRAKLIKRAASYGEVARIFVHPPIKAELCRWATGDRAWLAKVRPYYGHDFHFHIRMKCPAGFKGCKNQAPAAPKDGTGCGEELAYWMGPVPWAKRQIDPHAPPVKPAPPMMLSALPGKCRSIATAP